MIFFVELVLLLEGHVADTLVFLYQLLYTLLQILTGSLGTLGSPILVHRSSGLQTGYHVAFLLQVVALLATGVATSGIASLEEGVAGGGELLPQLVAQLLGHHTNLAPFLL